MVMRSDGGATDLAGFSAAPVRTLYSGPAASVAGALRYTGVTDAIVLEVGGTSTNIAAIRDGRPALSYVRVASHSTALRSVDVRVVGVAGGSIARVRRGRLYGIGPRSAHIAGLHYASLMAAIGIRWSDRLVRRSPPGDPADYVAIRTAAGEGATLTTTCAANFFGVAEPDDHIKTLVSTGPQRLQHQSQHLESPLLAAVDFSVCSSNALRRPHHNRRQRQARQRTKGLQNHVRAVSILKLSHAVVEGCGCVLLRNSGYEPLPIDEAQQLASFDRRQLTVGERNKRPRGNKRLQHVLVRITAASRKFSDRDRMRRSFGHGTPFRGAPYSAPRMARQRSSDWRTRR